MKKPAPAPAKDWEVRPRSPWNYALLAGPDDVTAMQVSEKPTGGYPFGPHGAPVEITARARRVPEWRLMEGSAGPLPASPVASTQPVETVTLIPYGSAKLRVTVFPRAKE
jgi:hypothetical protein